MEGQIHGSGISCFVNDSDREDVLHDDEIRSRKEQVLGYTREGRKGSGELGWERGL